MIVLPKRYPTLRVWIVAALNEVAAKPAVGGLAGAERAERAEFERLRRENRELKQTDEILKLARPVPNPRRFSGVGVRSGPPKSTAMTEP